MKKLYYLIVLTLILGLVLTGCLLSNVGQVPTSEQSGITYLTKNPSSSSLVGLWRFNGNADDSSGTIPPNNGTVYGATYDPSPMGWALSFDGDDDYVNCGNGDSLKPTQNITIEMWVKPNSTQNQWADILGGHQYNQGYVVQQDSTDLNNYYFAYNNDGTSAGWQGMWIKTELASDVWQHFVVQKEGSTIRHFLNGTLIASGTVSGDIWYSPIEPFYIGIGWLLTSDRYFEGSIDEVRIWNTALTADQIGDISPPVVTINAPADGGFYPVGAVPMPDFTVVDANSCTVEETGYSTDEGVHTYIVTATDVLGYVGSASVTYYVLENFVTGGGKIDKSTLGLPGKGAALTFAGTIGVLDGEGIVGQFQIVGHTELDGMGGKGAVSLHCSNFTYLEFSGVPAESPAATHNIATFEGNFTIKRGDIETVLLKLQIIDNGEPGAGVDTFCFCDPGCNPLTIDGGNFQVHNIDNED